MRRRDLLKEEIVRQKTVEMMVEHGFEGFSMNKLAAACNISVATLYIYYQNKEDLIYQIGVEMSGAMYAAFLDGFDVKMSFRDGLWKQWQNRLNYYLMHKAEFKFAEMMRRSPNTGWSERAAMEPFRDTMELFAANCRARGELKELNTQIYWSVAYAPLYMLIQFDQVGNAVGGIPYSINETDLKSAFELVLSSLSK